jgi:hypothetical protein
MRSQFDRTREMGNAPGQFVGAHVYTQVKDILAANGKKVGKQKGKKSALEKENQNQEQENDDRAPPNLKYLKKLSNLCELHY